MLARMHVVLISAVNQKACKLGASMKLVQTLPQKRPLLALVPYFYVLARLRACTLARLPVQAFVRACVHARAGTCARAWPSLLEVLTVFWGRGLRQSAK